MAKVEESPPTPLAPNPSPNPNTDEARHSQVSSSHPDNNGGSKKPPLCPKDLIVSAASKISAQPIHNSDPNVWGVLTAISSSARKRPQGINMLLTSDEHCIGRLVDDVRFQIESNAVSGSHCKIYRKRAATEEVEPPSLLCMPVFFLKDTSTNGTYLNWEKLKRSSPEAKLCHGDIISLAAPPQHGNIEYELAVLRYQCHVISFKGAYATPWSAPCHHLIRAHTIVVRFHQLSQSNVPVNVLLVLLALHKIAFAFVFREVLRSNAMTDGANLKRKAEEFGPESKRIKGIGIGAPEGPISLDDFRSLQRSNMELRKQLENQVITIDSLRNENRAVVERYENEMKDLKESVAKPYLDQLKELQNALEIKQKVLVEVEKICAEQKHAVEDLNEQLSASVQSCTEANEILNSQKASIAELKAQVDEEREQRREEREKAAVDLKLSIQRVQTEAQEELKRLSDTALRREREQQEVINKLQELEKEGCLLVETLRSKLVKFAYCLVFQKDGESLFNIKGIVSFTLSSQQEETRQKLVLSDNKVRQLEAQICEVQLASASERKKVEELEHEAEKLRKELESEKAAREEAWAKVSALELEINAAMRDLDFERRRLKGARERIMLRETQLRAFYSTTEEISSLFGKQQEQLKAMQRTLEDEENYENTSVDFDLNVTPYRGDINGTLARERQATANQINSADNAGSGPSIRRCGRNQLDNTSSDDASVTEKHDCDIRSQEDAQNTQEAEFTSAAQIVKGGFGSDIDGVGTERVLETESPGIDVDRNIDLNKGSVLGGDTMQIDDDDARVQDAVEGLRMISGENSHNSQSNDPLEVQNTMEEDTEAGGTIRTSDLLASEVVGSWACSTAPSVHGENESPRRDNESPRRENDEGGGGAALRNSSSQVAESQSNPSSEAKRNHERQALSEMIGIVAPDMKEQFSVAFGNNDSVKEKVQKGSGSNSDTEDCSDKDEDDNVGNTEGESISDGESKGGDRVYENNKSDDDTIDEDDEATQEDSTG
ncbi:hypothetical protein RHGRI_019196 [Rhododendron griersonianum]|uniref:FHA domain-containing protein n=1 Tax=Rhododendron griersonianum TaxID=479676 RepID=A0AAV6JFC5_9ERIC|nr:hypothetical protein RHGRI_019196 [Rhododendron griersonianum]